MTSDPEFIYGVHPVTEAILAGRRNILHVFILDNKRGELKRIEQLARERKLPITFCKKEEIQKRVKNNEHQGVAAEVSNYMYSTTQEILETWAISGKNAFFLILDSIEDPHNLGAISRTALLSGVHGIFIPERRSAKITPAVCKASSGAVEHIRIAIVKNLNNLIYNLKEHNVKIIGLSEYGNQELRNIEAKQDIALIIGSEGRGIAASHQKGCDYLVRIPVAFPGFSYNASVAAGIAMYEVVRQRSGA
jgi:23S rRNA (guanosine2251-2'-O)-methyltransferase